MLSPLVTETPARLNAGFHAAWVRGNGSNGTEKPDRIYLFDDNGLFNP